MTSFLQKSYFYIAIIFILDASSGCQVYNSSSQDEQKYSNSAVPTASTILQNRCGSCHSYGQKTFSQLVAQGMIVSGAPMSSLLFTRIRGSGSNQDENMPQAGSSAGDLTAEELAIVKNWILNGGTAAAAYFLTDEE